MKNKHAAREETAANEHEQHVTCAYPGTRTQGTCIGALPLNQTQEESLHKGAASGLQ